MHPQIQQSHPGSCPICGMTLEAVVTSTTSATEENDTEYTTMLTRFWVATALSLPLLVLNMAMHLTSIPIIQHLTNHPLFNILQLILATPVVLWCGFPFFQRAWISLKTLQLNMFTLIGMGIGVSYGYSLVLTLFQQTGLQGWIPADIPPDVYFEAAAVITALVLLGQVIELKARSKTSLAVRQLLELTPPTAWIINVMNPDQPDMEIPLSQVRVGDHLRVRPGGKVPVDGMILEGASAIDQSMVTGESLPLSKSVKDHVIGGTINTTGSFIMEAQQVGENTILSQIIDLVAQAQRSRAPIQKIVDQVSAIFVPTIILVALFTAVIWSLLGPEPRIAYALLTSVSVLIIACPCALGLATPLSIMVATGRGAREGILIKNAQALETFSQIDTLVVDKTGTLTEGKPKLREIVVAESVTAESILALAASLEKGSEHPIAQAILQAAQDRSLSIPECTFFLSITGQGVQGEINHQKVILGNALLLNSNNVDMADLTEKAMPYRQQGHTILFLAVDGVAMGFLTVADSIKPTSKEAIQALQKQGINVIMLTGDNGVTAQAIALELGITDVKADVQPDQKYQAVQALQALGHKVAMAGDGINDAPALSQSDVGIAMGTGADIAVESADLVILSGNLMGIVKARSLSHATMANIRQNLFLAFGYNGVAIPIAAGVLYPFFGVFLSPMIASAAMSFSSVSVILNALRLR